METKNIVIICITIIVGSCIIAGACYSALNTNLTITNTTGNSTVNNTTSNVSSQDSSNSNSNTQESVSSSKSSSNSAFSSDDGNSINGYNVGEKTPAGYEVSGKESERQVDEWYTSHPNTPCEA